MTFVDTLVVREAPTSKINESATVSPIKSATTWWCFTVLLTGMQRLSISYLLAPSETKQATQLRNHVFRTLSQHTKIATASIEPTNAYRIPKKIN